MNALLSRKLIGSAPAMSHAVGLVLGLAAIRPETFTQSPELVGVALAGILGLGGWQVMKQGGGDAAAHGAGGGGGTVSVLPEAEAVAEAAWGAQEPDLGVSLAALAFLPWLLGLAVLAGVI